VANWYATREQTKRAARASGVQVDDSIDRTIEASSRSIDQATRRYFIPRTETRLYRWPQANGSSVRLYLDQDLISVSALRTKAQDSSPTTISSSDYFLEPENQNPPYLRIEIDLSSTAAFEGGDTPQRSISVAGSWGYSANTRSSGTVTSGLASDSAATSMVCSDGSLIDVGDTLLIESEQLFVSERTNAAEPNSDLLDGALTKDASENVTVDSGSRYSVTEVIMVDTEKMLIVGINGNVLDVQRGFDGTAVAAHSNNTAVHVFRTLTIERGVNGTTAATHANSTAVSKYEPEFPINQLCVAEAVSAIKQEMAGWGRSIGIGDNTAELQSRGLASLRNETIMRYSRLREAVI